jgi:glycine cleavage system H protein
MATPQDRRYSAAHVWVRVEGDEATVGITDYAQDQLGDVVYLQLPEAGDALTRDQPFGLIESSKAAEDLVAPIDGEVVEANDEADGRPRLVNDSPYDRGWLIRVRFDDPEQIDGLMDGAAYDTLLGSGAESAS